MQDHTKHDDTRHSMQIRQDKQKDTHRYGHTNIQTYGQDSARQDLTNQSNTRQHEAIQYNTMPTKQDKTMQYNIIQDKTNQNETRQ